jgi:two-component system, OmpR family, sensor histidine kinase TctE
MRAALQRLLTALPGPRSLHRQLLLYLLLPQLVLWLAGAAVTYTVALRYANQAIDASLSQTSRALARQVKPVGTGLFIDFPRAAQDIVEADPNDRVYYMVSTPPGQFILGNRTLPQPPSIESPRLGEPYFYDGVMTQGPQAADVTLPVRVAALYLAYGDATATTDAMEGAKQTLLVQIARSRASRDALARSILIDTALPLSALIALMSLIVWAGIRAGLQPLAKLRAQVEDREPNDLAPLQIEAAPQEVRALARALNALLAAVQRNVGLQKRFIGDAAHQLRTPLAGLKSQTELALQDTADTARLRDGDAVAGLRARLARVHEGATRSTHLVNQLLTLARAEPESTAAQSRAPLDIRQLARDVAAELVPRALQAGIDLGFDESAADAVRLEVSGIALLLREALVNLVDNAIRYAGRGSVVTLRAARRNRLAVVEVEDNGPGIAPADRERVFDRFVRATDQGSGCGLGLAIVKEIVERHGGTVQLLASAPQGLRVELMLPLRT